jgi:ABC-type antimicrobial peptide transport system permease subunit
MNIRVALGARAAQVFAMVLRQSIAPVLIGLAGGLVGVLAIGGVVTSLLYEVRPRDPVVLSVVVGIVAAVGTLSAAAAARSGLEIDPAAALREE